MASLYFYEMQVLSRKGATFVTKKCKLCHGVISSGDWKSIK